MARGDKSRWISGLGFKKILRGLKIMEEKNKEIGY
jgi:hypothetical protein